MHRPFTDIATLASTLALLLPLSAGAAPDDPLGPPDAISGDERTSQPANPDDTVDPDDARASYAGSYRDNTPAGAPTSQVWREPRVPINPLWHLLSIPERVVETAVLPLGLMIGLVERYRLERRLIDLLENDAGTIKFRPKFKLSFGDGFGLGGSLSYTAPQRSDLDIDISALGRLNGDGELRVHYKQALPSLEGRFIQLRADYEVDRNEPYFGIGKDSAVEDERALRLDTWNADAELDLRGRGELDVSGFLALSYRHQKLSTGTDPDVPGLVADDAVTPPVEFGDDFDFVRASIGLIYDSRDMRGRPTRGVVIDSQGAFTLDVSGTGLNAMSARINVRGYLPLLPRQRVLILSAGTGVSVPLSRGDEVPLHELVTLGRRSYLRGYERTRFRDRLGWWASAEYQYPIYEYMSTGVTLSSALFVEIGHVASSVEEYAVGPIYRNVGVGLRGAHDTVAIVDFSFAISPEGTEIVFDLGRTF